MGKNGKIDNPSIGVKELSEEDNILDIIEYKVLNALDDASMMLAKLHKRNRTDKTEDVPPAEREE